MAEDTKVETPQPEAAGAESNDVDQLVTAPSALSESTAEPELDEEIEVEPDDETTAGEDDEPDKKGLAKKLEKNNYEFRNFQREMRDTLTKLQEAVAGIKDAPTAKQEQKISDIQQDLAALFDEKRDEMDNLSVAEARIIAKQLAALNKRLEESTSSAVSPLKQQLSAVQESQDRANFAREHPELAAKYDSLLAKARTRLQQYPAGESRRTAAQFIWRDVVNEAKTAKTPQPKKPVPGANPLRSSAAASRGTRRDDGDMTESDYDSLIESPRP